MEENWEAIVTRPQMEALFRGLVEIRFETARLLVQDFFGNNPDIPGFDKAAMVVLTAIERAFNQSIVKHYRTFHDREMNERQEDFRYPATLEQENRDLTALGVFQSENDIRAFTHGYLPERSDLSIIEEFFKPVKSQGSDCSQVATQTNNQ